MNFGTVEKLGEMSVPCVATWLQGRKGYKNTLWGIERTIVLGNERILLLVHQCFLTEMTLK